MAEFVHITSSDDGVAVVRIDNPPVNAITWQTDDELVAALGSLAADREVRAVVLWGGEKLFSAGLDLAESVHLTEQQYAAADGLGAGARAVAAFPKPTVAAVTGHALGTGLRLALAADYRVAGDNVRIGLPEVRQGGAPSAAVLGRVADLAGPAVAKDLAWTGRSIGASEALRHGLIDAVVAPDDVPAEALVVARRYGAHPVAAAAIKAAIEHGGPDPAVVLFTDPGRRAAIVDYLDLGPRVESA